MDTRGRVNRHIRRTKQDTLELLRILRDGVPERKSRTGSKASPRSLKHGLKARRVSGWGGNLTDIPMSSGSTPGGRGNFQSVKLQRPGRVTVCSHSARDTTASVDRNFHFAIPATSQYKPESPFLKQITAPLGLSNQPRYKSAWVPKGRPGRRRTSCLRCGVVATTG
jgi:hypothetical protein